MKEEKSLKEKISLLERELATITERLEATTASLKDLEDVKRELRGLKLFIGRAHPDFKSQFPEVMRKIKC